jgi:hypothetical protein
MAKTHNIDFVTDWQFEKIRLVCRMANIIRESGEWYVQDFDHVRVAARCYQDSEHGNQWMITWLLYPDLDRARYLHISGFRKATDPWVYETV